MFRLRVFWVDFVVQCVHTVPYGTCTCENQRLQSHIFHWVVEGSADGRLYLDICPHGVGDINCDQPSLSENTAMGKEK